MPGTNSWNGRWSGEETLYAIIKKFPNTLKAQARADEILKQGYYSHNFGDGWRAGISVRRPKDAKDLNNVRKKTRGFCGYDWMVENILSHGSASDKKEDVPA